MVVLVVGPSKVGKTAATKALVALGTITALERYDLDEELGSANRSDGQRAADLLQRLLGRQSPQPLLVDVGAGQFFSDRFRARLIGVSAQPLPIAVMWCDEATFRSRHGVNAPNEVEKYYSASSPFTPFRQTASARDRVVDSSGPYAPMEWAEGLGRIVRAMITELGVS